ncbi:MAG TPA: hypothetical protein VN660_13000 [Steroidobacteraceae bacterium]|nr:hypothetical protein [Steroidobacteraceae bacterium]
MTLLTINTGSTSVKLALFELSTAPAAPRQISSAPPARETQHAVKALEALRAQLPRAPELIAHRVVHGGTGFLKPTLIDSRVLAAIESLTPLAPLHNPQALLWIRAALAVWGESIPQLAVFDTAFFANMPRVASEYALAPENGTALGVRRYGFHGLAHESMWRRWCQLYPALRGGGRLITLQLGGGCSIAAIEGGQPLDTSMGFSPLEGLVMARRSGDLDPAVIVYLQRKLSLSAEAVLELLESHSGLAGVAGEDANPTQLLDSPDSRAQFAVELYCYRIRKYLGAYMAVLGGCDGIVFGGGVGEHEPRVRTRALEGLHVFGARLDESRNGAARRGEACLSAEGCPIRIHVLESNEESILAAAGSAFLAS